MGALQALTWGRLPPAGDRVLLARSTGDDAREADSLFDAPVRFFASGTAALAAAVRAAVLRAGRRDPEVLLPAYTCPNVVSAVLHAGARPRLVDLQAQRPWMNLDDLRAKLAPSTAAIVAVDFLGLPERYAPLMALARQAGITVIQDRAQSFPRRGESFCTADIAVASFGRGKPVSVLGGGAVIVGDQALVPHLPDPKPSASSVRNRLRFRLQVAAYNALRAPALYRIPASLPMLHLGETRFVPLPRVEAMDTHRRWQLRQNIEAYWQREDGCQETITEMLAGLRHQGVIDLAVACFPNATPRLLRYPVLIAEPSRRDRLYRALERAGLGASTMYGVSLPRIPGLVDRWPREAYPGADAFARQLLTLPLHDRVTRDHLARIRLEFLRALSSAEALPVPRAS